MRSEADVSAADLQLVNSRVDELLHGSDPRVMPQSAFWGRQFDLGLAWVHFPVGHGGLGLSPEAQRVVYDRLVDAGARFPAAVNPMGIGMAAPTIVTHGSEEQRRKYLRPCFTCEDTWCQLFSEPGAGSDVANLSTMAVRDGDTWVVNGQKVWTSLARDARWGLLLARSSPEKPKHKGLTYFVVDMHAPGITIRPIRQIDGSAHFNEVFFDDVEIPDAGRLSEVDDGWRTALTTLMNERVLLGRRAGTPRGSGPTAAAVDIWRRNGHSDPVRRERLMQLWSRAEVIRLTRMRAEAARDRGVPGPEGSITKLATAELEQEIFELCVDLLGSDGMLWADPKPLPSSDGKDHGQVDPRSAFLSSQSNTIAGGTSEIMRNILGERVLGLPGDLRVDKGVPWNVTLRA